MEPLLFLIKATEDLIPVEFFFKRTELVVTCLMVLLGIAFGKFSRTKGPDAVLARGLISEARTPSPDPRL